MTGEVLPLGVLIPVRNSMDWLDRHLEGLRPWLPRVQEIVVVDSDSTDGSAEYLRRHLPASITRHLSHPPGLYESWNYGLRHISSKWTCISTVGDCIPEATIDGLIAEGEEKECDVVISPPVFVSSSGEKLEKRWPLHKYIESRGLTRPFRIPGIEVFLWNALSVPGSLLGSSASNIYRTEYIQAHPFPEGYLRACDTAWALKNSFNARWVVAPDLYSEFLVHPASYRSSGSQRRQLSMRLHELAQGVFGSVTTDGCQENILYTVLLNDYWDASMSALKAKLKYLEIRDQGVPWFLRYDAWRARSRRNRQVMRASQVRALILDKIAVVHGPVGGG